MDAVVVEGISKTFGTQKAVDRVGFSVPGGSIFGLLGPNGSGKTTTIRMILKILLPDEGSVRVLGRDLDESTRDRIGYLPEERGLYKSMRVDDHLVFFGELHGLSPAEARTRTRSWLDRFEIRDWSRRKIQELSKGMQQKIQFIGTILHEPELVILDEPFSGLDPVNARLIKDVMLEMKEKGRTVIFSTHQMEQVEKSCDRICLIHRGRVVLEGELSRIRRDYGRNSLRVEYDGDFPMSVVQPMAEAIDNHGHFVEVRLKRPEDAPALLRALVAHVDVRRFEMAEASLNEIFIDQVEGAR